jgi:hypothetical protein
MSRDAPGSIRSRDVLATFLLRFQFATRRGWTVTDAIEELALMPKITAPSARSCSTRRKRNKKVAVHPDPEPL